MNAQNQVHPELSRGIQSERSTGVLGYGDERDLPSAAMPRTAATINPEVTDKPVRRRYTAEYKRAILQEADRCTKKGEIGTLLRREGLYSTHLTAWRREREAGVLAGLRGRRRGPKATRDPRDQQIGELQRENGQLKRKLRLAEAIIDVQKKISDLLGIPQPERIDGETP